jgi:hypothetical protein
MNIFLLHQSQLFFSKLDLAVFVQFISISPGSEITEKPIEVFREILRTNGMDTNIDRDIERFNISGIEFLVGIFKEDRCDWVNNRARLLLNVQEMKLEYEKTGKISNKMLLGRNHTRDGNVSVIGPFYFPAEKTKVEDDRLFMKQEEVSFQKSRKIKKETRGGGFRVSEESNRSTEPIHALVNQTFDSSMFNNPSEKEAFNVSQINMSQTMNLNSMINDMKRNSFGKFDRISELREEYIQAEHTQPNVASYNGQCPYFVNEKQYDAIIRRRKKKQKRMLLYGKSKILVQY